MVARTCFECGAILSPSSLKCPKCGYTPDVEFMRKCPNLQGAVCNITHSLCHFLGTYQTCPVKNKADKEVLY